MTDALPMLAELVAPLGVLKDTELLTGGQFATTYRVTLTDGSRVIVKTAPTRTDQLLAYEHDLLRAEALVYGLAASIPDLLMPTVLLTDFSRRLLPSGTPGRWLTTSASLGSTVREKSVSSTVGILRAGTDAASS